MKLQGKTHPLKYLLLFLLWLGTGCSNPQGKSYKVSVTETTPIGVGTYCTYAIISPTNECLPRDFLVDVCEKYNVGDVVVIEMAKGSQWRECP
jgi:hypothetical protein